MSDTLDTAKLNDVMADLWDEIEHATTKHKGFVSPHEGYAVILEELDELWDEVKKDGGGRDAAARKEAMQVAAVAIRYIMDLIDGSP